VAEEVEVTIASDGKLTMHVRGVEGMSCIADTEALVAALGGVVEEHTLTADAYVQAEESQQDRLWH
jgi:hypothetical protein